METHEELRPYLFAIAYRMLGSVAEAEDVVQEAFLRYHEAGVEAESPKAYLATVTTRLAIDQLRSARVRREVYPGEWLPEPLVDDEAVRHAETADCAVAGVPAPAREALARRARGLPAPRGLRLPVRRGRPHRRQEPREQPPDPGARAPAHRAGQAPLRGLARGAGRGRAPLPRRLGGGRHRCADRAARPRRDRLRRRRRQGARHPGAARRRRAGREGADRLGSAGARARYRPSPRRASTASPASSSTSPTGGRSGSPRSRSRTGSSSPCARCSTPTSSRTFEHGRRGVR